MYNTNGPKNEFPYNTEHEIFDANRIIDALTTDKKPAEAQIKQKVKELV